MLDLGPPIIAGKHPLFQAQYAFPLRKSRIRTNEKPFFKVTLILEDHASKVKPGRQDPNFW
jgi:hypothetical protein